MASDQFALWRKLIADPKALGTTVIVNEDDPAPGYYRLRNTKQGPWLPVVFWYDKEGVLRCLHAKAEVFDLDQMRRLWVWCVKNPITAQAYKAWAATGQWGDVAESVADQVAREGSNTADVSPEELLSSQIESALADLKNYTSVGDDETAARAQSLRARLLELGGEADKIRVRLKAPHKEAADAVDRTWMPLVKQAEAGGLQVRKALNDWETLKLARTRVAEAKERERLREEYEAEVAAAQEHAMPEPAAPIEPEPVEVKGQVGGGYGKRASVRTRWIVGEITDLTALFNFYKHREEVRDCLLKLANADVVRSRDIPGITPKEIADVR